MTSAEFTELGWRIPFLTSAILVVFSYFIRKKMAETPVFEALKRSNNLSKSPIKDSLGSKASLKKMLVIIFGGNAAQSTIMQTAQFVTLYFLQRAMKVDENNSLIILVLSISLSIMIQKKKKKVGCCCDNFLSMGGKWSNRYGRSKVIYLGLCLAAVSIPAFVLPFSLCLRKTCNN